MGSGRSDMKMKEQQEREYSLLGPGREVLSVERDVLLETLDDGLVFEEEDGTLGSGEAVQASLRGRVSLGGEDGLESGLDRVPVLGVRVTEDDDGASGLRVEGRRRVLDNFLDELDDLN